MGDGLKKLAEDIEEYRGLCEKYGEEVQTRTGAYGHSVPDPYCAHAKGLKQRELTEDAQRSDTAQS